MKKEQQSNQMEREEFYEHKPKRELKASLSKDGRYWILKDITTHIVSREYLSKVEDSFQSEGVQNGSGAKKVGARND